MNYSGEIDYRRKWHTMAAVGAGVFLATVDSSIINVSLPTLVRALNTEFSLVQWVVLAYLLTVTASMLSIGRVADILGKKSIYMLGFVIFTIGSALCGVALSVWWLIALFLSLLSLLVGLTFGQQQGFLTPVVKIMFSLWLIMLASFILVEKKTSQPMIDLRMFKNLLFSINLATGLISFIALAGVLILIPFYLENILGFEIMHVGLLMGIVPVMLGIMSPFSGSLSDRTGTRPITMIGLSVLLIGYLSASTLNQDTTVFGYLIRMFAVGLGMGVFVSPNNSAIMGTALRHQLGVVSGFMAITRTLGQTVGVAVMGAIWAGRTASYAGENFHGGVTLAPVGAQIAALHDTFHSAAVLLAFALFLGVWATIHESRIKRRHPEPNPNVG